MGGGCVCVWGGGMCVCVGGRGGVCVCLCAHGVCICATMYGWVCVGGGGGLWAGADVVIWRCRCGHPCSDTGTVLRGKNVTSDTMC